MKSLIIIFISVLFIAASCEKKGGEGQRLKKPEKIKKEIDALKDSMDTSWRNMTNSDDQKLKDVKRLLDEVSYTNNYNTELYDSMVSFQKRVLAIRYDSITMNDSKKIDVYDAATDSLLKGTFKLVNATKDIESHPIAKTLTEDIMKADNDLVLYRARYDRWAKEFNIYIEKNQKNLKKIGAPYSNYSKRPMFTISQ